MSSPKEYSSTPFHSSDNDIVKDIILWRKKKHSAAVLIAATATWVLMQVYQFNFITVTSWIAIFVVSSLFLWANILKISGKEPPSLSGLELSEQTALKMANTARAWIEEGTRWMFRVSAEADWPSFLGVVAVLWLISCVGGCVHFLTFLYIGTVVSMTVPVTYMKEERRIKSWKEWLKAKCRKTYEMVDERSQRTFKNSKTRLPLTVMQRKKTRKQSSSICMAYVVEVLNNVNVVVK